MLTPRHTGIFLICAILGSSGCATMIARSGLGSAESIPLSLPRKQIHERFGDPISIAVTDSGRPVEIFHVRRELEDFKPGDEVQCWASGACFLLWPILLGHTVIKSEANRVHVALIYGPDDTTLYSYFLNADPATRYEQALIGLAHPLLNPNEFKKCERLSPCLTDYFNETRRRAVDVGYDLPTAAEKLIQWQLHAADDIDNRRISREDVIKQLAKVQQSELGKTALTAPVDFTNRSLARALYHSIHPLTALFINRLSTAECENLAICVTQYQRDVQQHAVRIGYVLTLHDIDVFKEEMEAAENGDSGKLNREEAIGHLQGMTTRHLVRLYRDGV